MICNPRFLHRGASNVEYALITMLIAIVAIGMLTALGATVASPFQMAVSEIETQQGARAGVDFTVLTADPRVGEPVEFDGQPQWNSYSWDFGDGTPPATVEDPSHTYVYAGLYTVTLFTDAGSVSKAVYVDIDYDEQVLALNPLLYWRLGEAAYTNGAELLPNPSFDTDTSGWSAWGATHAWDVLGRTTAGSLKRTATATSGAAYEDTAISGATMGRRFRASVWLYVPPGDGAIGASVRLAQEEQGGATGAQYHSGPVVVLVAGWQYLEHLITLTQNDRTMIRTYYGISAEGVSVGDIWHLDDASLIEQIGDTAATDASGNGLDGSYFGSTERGSASLLVDDADPSITVGAASESHVSRSSMAAGPAGGVTVSVLVAPTTISGATRTIMSWDSQAFAGYHWFYSTAAGRLTWQFTDGVAYRAVPFDAFLLAPGQTYHIVVSHDYASGEVRWLVNGSEEVDNVASLGDPIRIAAGQQLHIGSYSTTMHRFVGRIDEFVIFDGSRSDLEMMDLYRAAIDN